MNAPPVLAVTRRETLTRTIALVVVTLAVAACTTSDGSTSTPPLTTRLTVSQSTTTQTTTPSTTLAAQPADPTHRIAIRTVDGAAEFYDTVTGDRFVPRGNNYNILREMNDAANGFVAVDVTLSTSFYDTAQVEADLSRMQEMGYNIVRIFPETCGATGCITGMTGGIRGEFMDNMVDFMKRAKAHGIYTWIASNTLPDVGKYLSEAYAADNDEFQGANSRFLTVGGVTAYRRYFTDLVTELIERDAPFDYIFSFSLRQEHNFDLALPPLSLNAGEVTTVNGETYDMANDEDRMRMLDDGLRYWIAETGAAIRELDPSMLISVGFFAPNEPNVFRPADDLRLVRAVAALDSDADFVDFHVYPTPPHALLAQHVENYQMEGRADIPIVMGEVAAFTWYTSEAAAAKALHDLQVDSCAAGFDGWLTWSWYIPAQPDIWHAMTGEGLVGDVLAPTSRPDPCAPGAFDFFEYSLTDGASVTASQSLPDQPPGAAIDGGGAIWGSGGDATQWIEITLASPAALDEIRLTVAQFPEGPTRHELWVRPSGGSLKLLHTFEGFTADGDILSFIPDVPLADADLVRVVTTDSPSWVAWQEISLISYTAPPG